MKRLLIAVGLLLALAACGAKGKYRSDIPAKPPWWKRVPEEADIAWKTPGGTVYVAGFLDGYALFVNRRIVLNCGRRFDGQTAKLVTKSGVAANLDACVPVLREGQTAGIFKRLVGEPTIRLDAHGFLSGKKPGSEIVRYMASRN